MSQLINLPLNEQSGATVAINTANPDLSALIVGGSFQTDGGRAGLHLSAGGYAQVGAGPVFSLETNFTLIGYAKADGIGSPTNTFLTLKFAGADQYLTSRLNSALSAWSLLKIEQVISGSTGTLTVTLDGQLIQTGNYPTGWGTPTGLLLYNDDVSTAMGHITWSAITFDAELSKRPQLIGPVSYRRIPTVEPAPAPSGSLAYFINGIDFAQFGVGVSESRGLLDGLAMKLSRSYDWPDQHGEVIDLSTPRFQARTIELDCFLLADSSGQFLQRWTGLLSQFQKANTQRLQINLFDQEPLVYDVCITDPAELSKIWRNGPMGGRFTLKLKEPDPVKRVLAFDGPGQLTMTLSCEEPLNIHFGDGTHEYDVEGSSQIINHAYAGTGTYYIILAGLIEQITQLDHNGTLTWDRL
ncbi:hypothetical protein A6C57_00355 [Fibrella sp. ES10-3-2-2]|nr:hypothetical protein A6C57_00355 [Fibrella sp. ES10-3-2-2]